MKKAISFLMFVIFAFTYAAIAQQGTGRTLHFPLNYSLGKIYIRDESLVRKIEDFHHHVDGVQGKLEYLGPAIGDVHIPSGKVVYLNINILLYRQPQLLSALKNLGPDDLYSLTMEYFTMMPDTVPPDDRCMPYIAHLTGLK